jgi:deoxyribodipyrimidine photolyase-related protein
VLGDQLSPSLSAMRDADPARDCVLLMEVAEETTYVRHHPKKIALVLAAMRAFARRLETDGFGVAYVRLDDPANTGSFTGEIARAAQRLQPRRIVTTEGSEYRVLGAQKGWAEATGLPVDIREDDRFLCSKADFQAWAADRKGLRMEYFYREMRRRTGILMDHDQPLGGRWNFDAENRKPAAADLFMPQPPAFAPDADTEAVLDLVEARFSSHFGRLRPFRFAVTAEGAEAAFTHFLTAALPRFGDYQDAMLRGEKWLYHAVVSMYLNLGLLDALDLCRRAEAEYHAGRAPLNAVEGFVRQILGWREYVRGIYWLRMPNYLSVNALDARRPVPAFYWTAETDMACIRACVEQTRDEAYAHHIQRLMVTGNFALLAGLDPVQVHTWYLEVYADAYEWVEAPNTIGMALFADGGLLGSKPYAASGAYIDRMSDYCRGCAYDVKAKAGKAACPFNYLYWDFLARNREKLGGNPRLAQMYRSYDRFSDERRAEIAADAQRFLDGLDGGYA